MKVIPIPQLPLIASRLGLGDLDKAQKLLEAYREWAAEELNKIFLSARLVGVPVQYMPTAEGRQIGMKERDCESEAFGAICHVFYHPLMGTLFIHGRPEIMLKKIRIPGINAEYRNYCEEARETVRYQNEHGETQSVATIGAFKYTVYHSTGNDVI